MSTLYACYLVREIASAHFVEYFFANDLRLNRYFKPIVNIGAKNDMKVNNEYALSNLVVFPCLEEQKKIVEFLTAFEERIGKLKRKKKLLEEYKRGMMQKLFSQQVRFKDEHGQQYPDWIERQFGEVVVRRNKKNTSPSNMMCCVEMDSIEKKTGRLLVVYPVPEMPRTIFSKNDILFGKLRPYLRKFWRADFDGVCSSEFWVFDGENSSKLTEYLIQTRAFQRASSIAEGSKMPRADWSVVRKCRVRIPVSNEEGNKILGFLTGLDEKLVHLGQRIEKSEEFKRGLLQKMFV